MTRENAHPRIVANEAELRVALARAGHRIRSQTDSELIAHLIEDLLEHTPAGPERLLLATLAAFDKLRGLNAIVVLDLQSGELAAAKSGSPLVLGYDASGHFIASDQAALLEHTRTLSFVHDGQAALLTRDRARLFEIASLQEVEPQRVTVCLRPESVERGAIPTT